MFRERDFLAGQLNSEIFSLPYSLLLDYSYLSSLPYPTLPEIEKPLPFRAWCIVPNMDYVVLVCVVYIGRKIRKLHCLFCVYWIVKLIYEKLKKCNHRQHCMRISEGMCINPDHPDVCGRHIQWLGEISPNKTPNININQQDSKYEYHITRPQIYQDPK